MKPLVLAALLFALVRCSTETPTKGTSASSGAKGEVKTAESEDDAETDAETEKEKEEKKANPGTTASPASPAGASAATGETGASGSETASDATNPDKAPEPPAEGSGEASGEASASGSEVAARPDLAGDWYFDGKLKCTIVVGDGDALTFTNELGAVATGSWVSDTRLNSVTWGNLGATLSSDAKLISWDNDTRWTRELTL